MDRSSEGLKGEELNILSPSCTEYSIKLDVEEANANAVPGGGGVRMVVKEDYRRSICSHHQAAIVMSLAV